MKNLESGQTALQIAKQKVEFRIHLVTFILVNSFLVLLNINFTPEYFWFVWPLMGWGIGIILHAINVYYVEKIRNNNA